MPVNSCQSGVRILSLDDHDVQFGSEPALYVGNGASDEQDQLVLELVSDKPVTNIDLMGESDGAGNTIGLDAGVKFEKVGYDERVGYHYKVTLTPTNSGALVSADAIKKTSVMLGIKCEGDPKNASPEILEYSFLLLQPSRVNQSYYKVAQLPEIKDSVFDRFATGIFHISVGMQGLIEKNFKDVDLPIDSKSGAIGSLSKKDALWVAVVNEKMNELFLTGIAYYYSQYHPDKMPDFLKPYQDLASTAWEESVNNCMTYNDPDATVDMLSPNVSGATTDLYDVARWGMYAYSSVGGSGARIPLSKWTSGETACFADLGNAHLFADVGKIEVSVGNGSSAAWQAAMMPGRVETANSISITSDPNDDLPARMMVASLLQSLYYGATVKPAQREAVLQYRNETVEGDSCPMPIPTTVEQIIDSYE